MGGEVTEILGWLGSAGGGAAGLVILYKLGFIKVNGNGAMKEKLTHIETTLDREADILGEQTTILKTQKEVINYKLDQIVKLQEKCLDKLDE